MKISLITEKQFSPSFNAKKRYHSDNWSHANFNPKEIGSKLAESVLGLFDPTLEGQEDNTAGGVGGGASKGMEMLIPRYKEPVVELTQLPGTIFSFVIDS